MTTVILSGSLNKHDPWPGRTPVTDLVAVFEGRGRHREYDPDETVEIFTVESNASHHAFNEDPNLPKKRWWRSLADKLNPLTVSVVTVSALTAFAGAYLVGWVA